MDRQLPYTLSRKEKLKSRATIEKLFSEGKSLFVFPLKLIYLQLNTDSDLDIPFKFGVTIPKRLHKKATTRNQLKRIVREAYRQNKPHPIGEKDSLRNYALMYVLVDRQISDSATVTKAIRRLHQKLLSKTNIDE